MVRPGAGPVGGGRFWALLSLTPLLLVLVARIGYLTPLFGECRCRRRGQDLAAAEHVLAPSPVEGVAQPVLTDVLRTVELHTVEAGSSPSVPARPGRAPPQ